VSDQKAAYDRLIAPHERRIRSYVRRLVPDAEDASDAAQEVLITAYRKVGPCRSPAEAFRWLQAVARSVSHRYAARRARARVADEPGAEPREPGEAKRSPSGEEAFLLAESWDRALDVIDSLPSKYRQPLCLRCMDGLAYEDISAHLGLSHLQVAERLRAGREKLRKALAQRWERRWPPGTECEWVSERLGRYLQGDLRMEQIVRIEDHAEVCPDCGERLAASCDEGEMGLDLEAWAAGLRQQPPDAQAEAQSRQAAESWPAARCLRAMERIAAGLARQPDDFGWLALRGIFATSAFELPNAEAVDAGERLVSLWPGRGLSWLTLANALDVWPDESAALQEAMMAGGRAGVAGAGPEPACQALGDLAIHRLFEGAPAEAERLARSALDLCPHDPWGWMVLAAAHSAQDRAEPALKAARQALRSARRRPAVYASVCEWTYSYGRLRDPLHMIYLAEQVVALAPRRSGAWSRLAATYAQAGITAQAAHTYWHGLQRMGIPQVLDLPSAGVALLNLSYAVGGSATRVAEHVFRQTHRSHFAYVGIDHAWTDELRTCIYYVMGRLFSRARRRITALECFAKARSGPLSPGMEWIREEADAIIAQRPGR
jgi:RNA polymerase sigma-70 factor (ECF subfamily)